MSAATLEMLPHTSLTWPLGATDTSAWDLSPLPSESTTRVDLCGWRTQWEPAETSSRPSLGIASIDQKSARVAATARAASRVLSNLSRYEGLLRGWDGYDAEPFDASLIHWARSLLFEITTRLLRADVAPDHLTSGPAPDGSIDVELRRGGRRLFFILYPLVERSEVTALEPGEPTILESLGEGSVERWIRWLVR